MLLEGMHIPLTTPLFPDGHLHVRKLEQNVARYSLTPAAGMLVLGETGEASMLSDDETRQVLASAVGAAATTKVMFAGIARDSVAETLALCDLAAGLSYDAAVVRAPPIAGLTATERRLYFEAVADRTALPLVLAGDLPVELVADIAGHPRILGWSHDFSRSGDIRWLLAKTTAVKRLVTVTPVFAPVTRRMEQDTRGSLLSAESLTQGTAVLTAPPAQTRKARMKTVGFQLLATGTERMLDALEAGAVGTASPFAAAAPQACHEVLAAWKDGDAPLAAEKQQRLLAALRHVDGELDVATIKYGCELNGYFGGAPRLPRLPLMGDERLAVEALMAGLKS